MIGANNSDKTITIHYINVVSRDHQTMDSQDFKSFQSWGAIPVEYVGKGINQ